MLKTLKKFSPIAGIAMLAILTGCPGGNVPTTGNTGTGTASIAGKVTKEDGSPATNATVVLIKKESGVDSDADIQRSDGNGVYSFNKVAAGNYRVAFVIQTEQERKDKTPIAYDPAGKSGQYFGAITTRSFDYNGDTSATYQVPAFNVGWVSNLSPNNTSVSVNGPVNFSWAAVPGTNVKYNVLIKDANDNPFYKSDELTGTSFSWTTLKGNQGNNNGTMATAGKYFYIVNAIFDTTGAPDNSPVITAGNTANASFTLQ